MPKLWDDTIAAHRRTVQDAIIEATAALVTEHGLTAVTMSQIADTSGVGRATLYRYFPDVESIVTAWHDRHVTQHLARLAEIRDAHSDPAKRLEAVLETYVRISIERSAHDGPHRHERAHRHDSTHRHDQHPWGHRPPGDVATLMHRREHISGAEERLRKFFRQVIDEAAHAGIVRDDVPSDELARYCLHALGAAGELRGEDAARRLLAVTLAGLRRGAVVRKAAGSTSRRAR